MLDSSDDLVSAAVAESGCGSEPCVLVDWPVVVMAMGFEWRRSSIGGVTSGSVIM